MSYDEDIPKYGSCAKLYIHCVPRNESNSFFRIFSYLYLTKDSVNLYDRRAIYVNTC